MSYTRSAWKREFTFGDSHLYSFIGEEGDLRIFGSGTDDGGFEVIKKEDFFELIVSVLHQAEIELNMKQMKKLAKEIDVKLRKRPLTYEEMSADVMKKGARKVSAGKRQIYLCNDCGKKFSNGTHSTHKSSLIIDAVCKYSLGWSASEVADINELIKEKRNLSPVCLVMMIKRYQSNSLTDFIYPESQNKTLYDMDPSFSLEVIHEGLIMRGIFQNLSSLIVESLPENRILAASLVDASLAGWHDFKRVHGIHLNNSSTDLSRIGFSFLANSSFLIYSSFNGSSSTGCQSIFSQNSQSSSVTSPVFKYLANISCFNNFSRATSDQFIHENLSNSLISLASNGNVKLAIYNNPLLSNSFSFSSFSSIPCFAISGQLVCGSLFNFSLSSAGIDTVNLFIINNPPCCVDTRNCVEVYKDSGLILEKETNSEIGGSKDLGLENSAEIDGGKNWVLLTVDEGEKASNLGQWAGEVTIHPIISGIYEMIFDELIGEAC